MVNKLHCLVDIILFVLLLGLPCRLSLFLSLSLPLGIKTWGNGVGISQVSSLSFFPPSFFSLLLPPPPLLLLLFPSSITALTSFSLPPFELPPLLKRPPDQAFCRTCCYNKAFTFLQAFLFSRQWLSMKLAEAFHSKKGNQMGKKSWIIKEKYKNIKSSWRELWQLFPVHCVHGMPNHQSYSHTLTHTHIPTNLSP